MPIILFNRVVTNCCRNESRKNILLVHRESKELPCVSRVIKFTSSWQLKKGKTNEGRLPSLQNSRKTTIRYRWSEEFLLSVSLHIWIKTEMRVPESDSVKGIFLYDSMHNVPQTACFCFPPSYRPSLYPRVSLIGISGRYTDNAA